MSAKQLQTEFKRFRNAGFTAKRAFHNAKTLIQWRELEDERVRLVAEAECESYFDVYGDPEGYEGANGKRVSAEQARKEMIETLDRDGLWCVQSEYLTPDGKWNHADSVGMCAGYSSPLDPLENDYVSDLMASAIEQAENAWADAGMAV